MAEVAADGGWTPFDAISTCVVADRLRTGFSATHPRDRGGLGGPGRTWRDPRAIVGGSDAGAHLDTMCGAVYSTSLLAEGCAARTGQLEEAIRAC